MKEKTRDMAIIVVLAVLVVFSGIQTIEIQSIRSFGPAAATSQEAQAPEKSVGSGSYTLPSNLNDLQSMVGGC